MSKRRRAPMDSDQARQQLRSADLRATSCRIAVLQFLATARSPVSHSDVADKLVPKGFDKSTIYRSLTEFADAGLAARLDPGDHIWRFELLGSKAAGVTDHPHFMCVDCGTVTCVPELQVKVTAKKGHRKGDVGQITEILIKGHCTGCK